MISAGRSFCGLPPQGGLEAQVAHHFWGEALFLALPFILSPHRPSSNVWGRCVDDSCHAAGLGLALGPRVRAVLLGIIAARLSTKPDCRIREADPLDELGVHAQNFSQTSPCRT
jgi:hypothetical protein